MSISMAEQKSAVEAAEVSVYGILKNKILCLELEPGEKLSENALAAQLGVGRVQVREALAQLLEEGYIVVYPQKGTQVTQIEEGRIRQAIHGYLVFEQAVIRELCSMQLENEQFEQLEAMLQEQQTEGDGRDVLEFIQREQQLHYLMALYSDRAYLWDMFRGLDCDLLRLRYLLYCTYNTHVASYSLASRERSRVEGRLMLESIRHQDAEVACLLCSNYYNATLGSVSSLRSIYPQYFA